MVQKELQQPVRLLDNQMILLLPTSAAILQLVACQSEYQCIMQRNAKSFIKQSGLHLRTCNIPVLRWVAQ